jgi:hypothetical protein
MAHATSQAVRTVKTHWWRAVVLAALVWIGLEVHDVVHAVGVVKYMLVDSCAAPQP